MLCLLELLNFKNYIMSKIFSHYENDFDKAWYDSSNIVYSECDDKDSELKTVRIVFKSGATYEYLDVNVFDYLKFREASSQGIAFNKYIKKYKFNKLENSNIEDLKSELEKFTEYDYMIEFNDGKISVKKQNEEKSLIEIDATEEEFNKIEMIVKTFDKIKVKIQ